VSEEKDPLRQLAETQHAFTQWRLHDKKPGMPIPKVLWELAFALLAHFTVTRVATALKINGTDFKHRAIAAGVLPKSTMNRRKKSAKKTVKAKSPQSEPAFVEIQSKAESKKSEKVTPTTLKDPSAASQPAFVEMHAFLGAQKSDQSEPAKQGGQNAVSPWRLAWTRTDGARLEIQPPSFSQTQMYDLARSFLEA
jgi:hypothetical protein